MSNAKLLANDLPIYNDLTDDQKIFVEKVITEAELLASRYKAYNSITEFLPFGIKDTSKTIFFLETGILKNAISEYFSGLKDDAVNFYTGNPQYLKNYGKGDNPGDSDKIIDGIVGFDLMMERQKARNEKQEKNQSTNKEQGLDNLISQDENKVDLKTLSEFVKSFKEEVLENLTPEELAQKLQGLINELEKQKASDDEKINFDGLKDDENIENKNEEQDGQISEQIEQNNEEQNNGATNGNATNNATNIVELAKQNVSLYNQNIRL